MNWKPGDPAELRTALAFETEPVPEPEIGTGGRDSTRGIDETVESVIEPAIAVALDQRRDTKTELASTGLDLHLRWYTLSQARNSHSYSED